MMMTVISPQTASTAIHSAWRNGIDLALGKVLPVGDDQAERHQRQPSSSPGITPAMNRCATETVPPAASE